MSYFYDLHCHTIRSSDAPQTLQEIIKTAKKRGLDGVAITDHDEVHREPLRIDGIDLIPATEITTKEGDHLLGYFVEEKVKEGLDFKEAFSRVKAQGGFAVWAHPFRRREYLSDEEKERLLSLDGMEAGNAMDEREGREFAGKLAKEYGLLQTAGSDAHVCGQVGTGVLKVEERLNRENFIEVVKKGEVIVREEIASYRTSNIKWKKRIRWLRNALRLDLTRKTKIFFAKLVIRNYLRLNNLRLKKISFNLKEERV